MIRSGVTCFADMYYFEDAIAEATAEAGLRALCAQTVLRFPTPDATSYEEGLAHARDFIQRWRGHPLIVPGPAPHAPYTCTPEILRACAELALCYFQISADRFRTKTKLFGNVTARRPGRDLAQHCQLSGGQADVRPN